MTERIRFVTPDGLDLCGEADGPPGAPSVILLHGGGQTRHSWARTMRLLAASGYRVVSYDARGHGDSDWAPDGNYSLDAFAADLISIREALQGPVALVGASLGGLTSFLAIGRSIEPLANALVMVDVVLRPAQQGVQNILRFMQSAPDGFATLDDAASAVATYNPGRPRSNDATGLMRNLRRRNDNRLHWHWDPRLLQSVSGREPPLHAETLIEVSNNVLVPTLLVRGECSDVVDEDGVLEMSELVPHMEVSEVPGAGHMVAGDHNDAFAASIMAFLDRYLPAS